MNKFKCTLKADRAGMKKGTVIEVTTSLASCDANNIADACEAKFGKKSRDASHRQLRRKLCKDSTARASAYRLHQPLKGGQRTPCSWNDGNSESGEKITS